MSRHKFDVEDSMQPSGLYVAGNDVIETERGGDNPDHIEYLTKLYFQMPKWLAFYGVKS